jgi:AcrR family transcriptional regulator
MSPADTVPPPADRSIHILEAACRVIVREGPHGLRMARVAEEAKVSKALVHYYFATRQELLRNAFAFSEQRWQPAPSHAPIGVVVFSQPRAGRYEPPRPLPLQQRAAAHVRSLSRSPSAPSIRPRP